MFATIEINEFKDIIELFQKDTEEPIESRINMGRLFIQSDENELMLRFNPTTKTIIIARVAFKHTRKGYGSSLLSLLQDYGRKNDYHTIIMESIMSKENYDFVMKKGFERVGELMFEKDSPFYFFGNYKLDILSNQMNN